MQCLPSDYKIINKVASACSGHETLPLPAARRMDGWIIKSTATFYVFCCTRVLLRLIVRQNIFFSFSYSAFWALSGSGLWRSEASGTHDNETLTWMVEHCDVTVCMSEETSEQCGTMAFQCLQALKAIIHARSYSPPFLPIRIGIPIVPALCCVSAGTFVSIKCRVSSARSHWWGEWGGGLALQPLLGSVWRNLSPGRIPKLWDDLQIVSQPRCWATSVL